MLKLKSMLRLSSIIAFIIVAACGEVKEMKSVPTYSVSGTVSGATGATVNLTGVTTESATIDGNGNYSFAGLPSGNYTVAPSKSGFVFTPGSLAVTVNGANVANKNFTATAVVVPTYSISGTITGTTNATVNLTGASTNLSGASTASVTTDGSGNYSFAGLLNGSYTVTPSGSGFTFDPASSAVSVSDANVANKNFTATAVVVPTYSISGTITGVIGATVNLTGDAIASIPTEMNGNYSFAGLPSGSYTVTPSIAGYIFSPSSSAVTVNGANASGENFTATAVVVPTYSISGTITGTTNATVNLTGASTASVTTDGSGNYSFAGLLNGSYTVTPSGSGFTFDPVSSAVTVSDANVASVNFTATAVVVPTYSVSGTITGTTNATVNLTGDAIASIPTDVNGNYSFAGLSSGSYTVTPSIAGYIFSPSSSAVIVNSANVASVNFTVPMLATGKLLYPFDGGIYSMDLATSENTLLWRDYSFYQWMQYPEKIIPVRAGNIIAFQNSGYGGIHLLNLTTQTRTQAVWSGIDWVPFCRSWAMGSFDLTQSGDAVVFSSECSPRDIVLMKTDGTMYWTRITNDAASDSTPVIGSIADANGNLTIYFVSDKNGEVGIWQQSVNFASGDLVGAQTLFASNVMVLGDVNNTNEGETRAISVSPAYDQMAFVKDVGGIPHIVIKPLAGGAEVDLGQGYAPYWTADGKILYTNGGTLWVVNPDGTERKQVPTPSNISDVSEAVLVP